MVERKHVLQRVKSGDYLFASNDAQTLLRVYKYEEDGSLYDGDRQVTGWFWACARRPMPSPNAYVADILAWGDDWEFIAGPFTSRKQAIEEALRA